ncbi:MAG: hypothetical protein HYZ90_02185 [Candidatus Omnitrophica bacterium]|nr:hypothetical protein [Candidatus Omnitrophota bacterium]
MKRTRLCSSLLILALALSGTPSAFALRPHADTAGLEEKLAPARPSTGSGRDSRTGLEELPFWPGAAEVEPWGGPGFMPVLFTNGEGTFEVSAHLWDLPVPAELTAEEKRTVYGPWISDSPENQRVGDRPLKDAPPQVRLDIEKLLRREVAQTLHARYRLPGGNGALGKEMQVKMALHSVRVYMPGGNIRSGQPKMEVLYKAEISARDPVDSAFTVQIASPGGRQFRLGHKGWIRIQRWKRELKMKQAIQPDGKVVHVVQVPSSRDGWVQRRPHEDTGTVIERLVHEAADRAQPGQRTVLAADVGRGAGATEGNADIVDPEEVLDLLPAEGGSRGIDWIHLSEQGIWAGVRGHRRAEIVFEGTQENAEALIQNAKQFLEEFRGDFPHYNAWIVVREEGTVRLVIVPRNFGWSDQVLYMVDLEFDRRRYRLVTREEADRFGWLHLAPAGSSDFVIPPGRPVLPFAVDALALYGFVQARDPAHYNDWYLKPRIDKGLELAGLPRSDSRIQAMLKWMRDHSGKDPKRQARREILKAFNLLRNADTPDDLIRLIKAIQAMRPRHEEAFKGLPPRLRDRFTRELWKKIAEFSRSHPQRVRIEISALGAPVKRHQNGELPVVVGVGAPVLDLIETVEQDTLVVRPKAGGSPFHIVQTVSALNEVPVELVAMLGGETGRLVFQALDAQGIPVTRVEGPPQWENRASDMVPRPAALGYQGEIRLVGTGSDPSLGIQDVRRIWKAVRERLAGKKGVVIYGERIAGSRNQQRAVAETVKEEMEKTLQEGHRICVSYNASWSGEIARILLGSGAWGVFLDLGALASAAGSFVEDREFLRHMPPFVQENPELLTDPNFLREYQEEAALLAHAIRLKQDVKWGLVSLGAPGLVLVPGDEWRQGRPSVLLGFSYYRSGAADGAFGGLLEVMLREPGPSSAPALQALETATTSAGIYSKRPPALRGVPPTADEIRQAPLPDVRVILPPLSVREEAYASEEARLDLEEAGGPPHRFFQEIFRHLASFPGNNDSEGRLAPWWRALGQMRLGEIFENRVGSAGGRLMLLRALAELPQPPGGSLPAQEGEDLSARRLHHQQWRESPQGVYWLMTRLVHQFEDPLRREIRFLTGLEGRGAMVEWEDWIRNAGKLERNL